MEPPKATPLSSSLSLHFLYSFILILSHVELL